MTAATTPKGERRRAALVAAAGELLVEGGFESVRHRAVAERANIPLAATTYYFESLGDLLSSAVTHAGEADLAAIRDRVAQVSRRRRGGPALAKLLASVFFDCDAGADRDALVSRYERLVVSSRDPELVRTQAAVRRELAALHEQVLECSGRRVRRCAVETLMAVEDGAALSAFTAQDGDVCRFVREALVAVIDELAPMGDVRESSA